MRVYALHECSRKVLAGLLLAGASVIIVGNVSRFVIILRERNGNVCIQLYLFGKWSFAGKQSTDTELASVDVSMWLGCNPMITPES